MSKTSTQNVDTKSQRRTYRNFMKRIESAMEDRLSNIGYNEEAKNVCKPVTYIYVHKNHVLDVASNGRGRFQTERKFVGHCRDDASSERNEQS